MKLHKSQRRQPRVRVLELSRDGLSALVEAPKMTERDKEYLLHFIGEIRASVQATPAADIFASMTRFAILDSPIPGRRRVVLDVSFPSHSWPANPE